MWFGYEDNRIELYGGYWIMNICKLIIDDGEILKFIRIIVWGFI